LLPNKHYLMSPGGWHTPRLGAGAGLEQQRAPVPAPVPPNAWAALTTQTEGSKASFPCNKCASEVHK